MAVNLAGHSSLGVNVRLTGGLRQPRLTTVDRSDAPIDLNDLIQAVEDETSSCTELERLDVAVKYGEQVKVVGDDLVGHFVGQARDAGASWAQVGERLGITKQAAHQRHVRMTPLRFGRRSRPSGKGPFDQFTQEAKDVIVTAQEEAHTLRHNYVGVEHLLLGLCADDIAGPILSAAGASKDAILEQVREIVGEGRETSATSIPFTPRAKTRTRAGSPYCWAIGPSRWASSPAARDDRTPRRCWSGGPRRPQGVEDRPPTRSGGDRSRGGRLTLARARCLMVTFQVPLRTYPGSRACT